MGNGCSHPIESLQFPATGDEIKAAVLGIESWQKAQEANRQSGGPMQIKGSSDGPLLARMGGHDTVKRVVELFYKKIYADETLTKYVYDKEVTYLRARQSAFMAWLFGTDNQAYPGRNIRIAHLRLIKQRGFSPDDLEKGFTHLENAMRDLGAPEALVSDVMAKVRPFKIQMFTPMLKDADEEAKWAAEDRAAAAAQAQAQPQQQAAPQASLSRPASLGSGPQGANNAAPADPAQGTGSRPASRLSQCPFSGAVLRPASAAGTAATPVAAQAVAPVARAPVAAAPASSRPVSARVAPEPVKASDSSPLLSGFTASDATQAAAVATAKPAIPPPPPPPPVAVEEAAPRAASPPSAAASAQAGGSSPTSSPGDAASSRPLSAASSGGVQPSPQEIPAQKAEAEDLLLLAEEEVAAPASKRIEETADDIVDAFLSEVDGLGGLEDAIAGLAADEAAAEKPTSP